MDGDCWDGSEPFSEECGTSQGEKRKIIQPTSKNDPDLNKLKEVLLDWINSTLKPEHIVVRALEEDLYDGLVLHHLFARLADVNIPVEEIALTSPAQIRKLEVILDALNHSLGVSEMEEKWSVKLIHSKDLLATLHLLVAMVRRFQADLPLPPSVSVEVVLFEVNKSGIKSEKQREYLTSESDSNKNKEKGSSKTDPIDELLKLESHKVVTVKRAILFFVNRSVATLGLQVTDMDKQFADGVILILLIGQLEGFFIPLSEFHLTPVSHSEMHHNVKFALDLLKDRELLLPSIDPQDIVSQDVTATLKVLYALFQKHKNR